MEKVIYNPQYFVLVHKQSGKKFNTRNTEIIKYDDEKFYIEGNQNRLF